MLRWRLPRASGDTPRTLVSKLRVREAAPRKWGYTDCEFGAHSARAGCPAQVGIHPRCRLCLHSRRRLPRASGDTPEDWVLGVTPAAAPRKWGYTVSGEGDPERSVGCPAQVGIHPNFNVFSSASLRLPRASGDTPEIMGTDIRLFEAAPRKWGYTPVPILAHSHHLGCPAQVGIHLRRRQGAIGANRLPRASGDTPAHAREKYGNLRAAPRKWGYTGTPANAVHAPAGCPAQVGIHRSGTRDIARCIRLPRASGDTP